MKLRKPNVELHPSCNIIWSVHNLNHAYSIIINTDTLTHTHTNIQNIYTGCWFFFFAQFVRYIKHTIVIYSKQRMKTEKMSKKIKTYNRHYESEIKRELQTLVHSNIIHMIK